MADIRKFTPVLMSVEGGFVNDPDDPGGATNLGVTLATWREAGYDIDGDGDIDGEDVRLLSLSDAVERVVKPMFWDRWRADEIHCQAVADILVDWLYNCGTPGIRIPQRLLGVTPDGIVGPETLKAVNGADQAELFAAIKSERIKYYSDLVARKPEMRKFFRGWMNRLLAYKFEI